jgi:hypothetical protein
MAIKFVNLLYKYLPAHYKVAPAEVELYLDEQLDVVDVDRNRYLTTTVNPDDTEIFFSIADDRDTLKSQGVVKIENEYIKYDNKDLVEAKLYNLERGYLSTDVTAHCNEVLWTATLETAVSAFDTTIVFKSITGGSQAIFTLQNNGTATHDVGFVTATDIDSSAGLTIWNYKGTHTRTSNWNPLVGSAVYASQN